MANEEHLDLLRQGVEVWNRWREERPNIRPNLSEANLNGTDLNGADLSRTNLFLADLSEANLSWADFSKANLRWVNLSEANLSKANLSEANLGGADLTGADLGKADLNGANLNGTNFRDAYLYRIDLSGVSFREANVGGTWFGDTDLSTVKELDTVVHHSPSTIGIDTLYNSKGQIPEAFLRGCGLKDWEIEAAKLYQPDLTSAEFTDIFYRINELRITAIHYYSCFISYSTKDTPFAQRLHNDLQAKGVRCWFAPENMKIGDKIRPRIDESIQIHDKLLIILSEHSINSAWVEKEVETAFEEESKRNQIVLFPVRLDKAVMETKQAWAADIRRTRHIGDFCEGEGSASYQKAFERLLRDLKVEGG